MTDQEPEFADDLLRGAAEIAKFLFGSPLKRRKVFHLVATSNIPTFKLGSMICARKSVLLTWIKEQEERSVGATRRQTKRGYLRSRNTEEISEDLPRAGNGPTGGTR